MIENEERFKYLFEQYVKRVANNKELKEFFEMVKSGKYKDIIQRLIDADTHEIHIDSEANEVDWERMYNEIIAPSNSFKPYFVRFLPFAAAAVVFLFVIGFAFYLHNTKIKKPTDTVAFNSSNIILTDVDPGSDKAIIQFEDGSEIELNKQPSGLLANQGNTKVTIMEEGVVAFQPETNEKGNEKIYYNTLRTPRGGTYMLVLPDKSKVWLNAASTIKFPNKFVGKNRHVQITGEVYFEIAKSKGQSFTVSTDNGDVTVLGTHFNVMSYPDEPNEEVTLLEGSIRLSSANIEKTLEPGQMASFNGKGSIGVQKLEFPDAKIDWKKGFFQFENENLEKIMHRVARWYDIKVVFTGNAIQKHFTGTIPRDEKVSGILNLLKASGNFQYEIHENIITIKL